MSMSGIRYLPRCVAGEDSTILSVIVPPGMQYAGKSCAQRPAAREVLQVEKSSKCHAGIIRVEQQQQLLDHLLVKLLTRLTCCLQISRIFGRSRNGQPVSLQHTIQKAAEWSAHDVQQV